MFYFYQNLFLPGTGWHVLGRDLLLNNKGYSMSACPEVWFNEYKVKYGERLLSWVEETACGQLHYGVTWGSVQKWVLRSL